LGPTPGDHWRVPSCDPVDCVGLIDVKPFISRSFAFADGIKALEEAAGGKPTDVKVQIVME
jgi:hypothetical protein